MQAKFDKPLSQDVVVSAKKLFDMTKEACTYGYTLCRGEEESSRETAKTELKNIACRAPRFFITPYTSYSDFGLTLAYATVAPLAFGMVASAATIIAAAGALVALGSLIITAGAAFTYLFTKDSECYLKPLDNFVYGALAAIISATVAVLADVLAPLALVALFTRSAVSLTSLSIDFFSKCGNKQEEEKAHDDIASAPSM